MITSNTSIIVKDCSTLSAAYNTNLKLGDAWPSPQIGDPFPYTGDPFPYIGDPFPYIGDPPVNPYDTKWIPQVHPSQITPFYGSDNKEFHKKLSHGAASSELRTKIDAADRLVFSLDVPGVKKGGVSVTIRGGALTITAKRADVDNHIHTVCAEVPRDFSVIPSDIEAWHEDGVINIAFVRIHNGTVDIAVD